ncbi:hypothetical protein, partial [Paenibacillus dendritiformis]|uniref:hypothetical protein n=1 Tax=Paenibacillus dendritiformis TaxID=130049 RepID=UPI001B2FF5BD
CSIFERSVTVPIWIWRAAGSLFDLLSAGGGVAGHGEVDSCIYTSFLAILASRHRNSCKSASFSRIFSSF